MILPVATSMHLDRAPVGAAVLDRISEQLAVLARRPFGERGRAVLRPADWGRSARGLAADAVADEQHRLVLKPAVVGVEIVPALFHRGGEALVIVELRSSASSSASRPGKRREKGVGHLVLGIDPGADLGIGADVVLEPAIRIGDRHAELGFDQIDAFGLRVSERRLRDRLRCGSRTRAGVTRQTVERRTTPSRLRRIRWLPEKTDAAG